MLFIIDREATIVIHATKQLMRFENPQHFLTFGFSRYGHFINGFHQHFSDQLRQGFTHALLQFYEPFGVNII